jgi:hypothetical protein
MLRINHWDQIETVPDPHTRAFLLDRRRLLTTDGEYDPEEDGGFLIVEAEDDVHRDFAFIGSRGLLSDLFEEHPPFTDGFSSPFEYAFHHPQFALHELYLQLNDTRCVVILIPEAVVEAHPDLRRLLNDLSVDAENPR